MPWKRATSKAPRAEKIEIGELIFHPCDTRIGSQPQRTLAILKADKRVGTQKTASSIDDLAAACRRGPE